jgi:hypothetical protein
LEKLNEFELGQKKLSEKAVRQTAWHNKSLKSSPCLPALKEEVVSNGYSCTNFMNLSLARNFEICESTCEHEYSLFTFMMTLAQMYFSNYDEK